MNNDRREKMIFCLLFSFLFLFPFPLHAQEEGEAEQVSSAPAQVSTPAPSIVEEVTPAPAQEDNDEQQATDTVPQANEETQQTIEEVQPGSAQDYAREQQTAEEYEAASAGNDPKEELISLDLKGVDINELMRVLSTKTGLTIVPSSAVTGRVNVYLNNVSFEDALDIILFTQNLAIDRKKDVLYVMTAAEYKALYGQDYFEKRKYKNIKLQYADPAGVFTVIEQLKSDIGKVIADEATGSIILIDIPEKLAIMEKVIAQLDTALETRVYDLNYAVVDDVKTHLAEVITAGTGKIIGDTRSSKVIVSDLPSRMDKIDEAIKNLDEKDQEVFIQAEIIQITLSDTTKRGIDWENLFSARKDDMDLIGKFPLGLEEPVGKITVGSVANQGYTATIEFLQTLGDVKILSRPRIAALNNEEAKILVGTREAFITSTSSQGESTTITSESIEYIDVGIKLNVTPTINKEGFITMKIKPEVSEVTSTLTTDAGSQVPIVSTSEAETSVRVKDGAMIMIAGLMKTERNENVSGVPFLSSIPWIGAAFSTKTRTDTDTEIVIFLTPHIISGESSVAGADVRDFMRNEILPDDIKEKIIREELEKIKSPFAAEQNEIAKDDRGAGTKKAEEIGGKLKGLKTY